MTTDPRQEIDQDFVQRFADRWHAAWNSYDPGRVVALCTPDIEIVQSSSPTVHGHTGAEESVRQLATAFNDYRFEETEPPFVSHDRRKAIVPWRLVGTMTGPMTPPGFAPTGMAIELCGDDHWEFRDVLLRRCRVLFDANELAIQVGAAPPPGSAGERIGVALQRLVARGMRKRAKQG